MLRRTPADDRETASADADGAVDAKRGSPAATDGVPKVTKKSKTKAADRTFARQGRRPHLSVTLGLGTLAGLDELPGTWLVRVHPSRARPQHRQIRRNDHGTTGRPGNRVDHPRRGAHLPAPQELRDQIAALLEVCQFPSCRQPVWRCDIDHREPFDHQHPEQGGQAPELWVSTARTAVVEKLDTMVFFTHWGEPVPDYDDRGAAVGSSVVEELLTALLLRHQLNEPPLEYEHVDGAWNICAGDHLGSEFASNANTDEDRYDDAPPF
jgi:hypothetical protein